MQRTVRTAVGRSVERGAIADLVGVRHDGRVDMMEIRSDTQTTAELMTKLSEERTLLPERYRGDIFVEEPLP
jgi:hypothetical protein